MNRPTLPRADAGGFVALACMHCLKGEVPVEIHKTLHAGPEAQNFNSAQP